MEIFERKTVRINLKKVVEDLLYAYTTNDEDEVKEVKNHFELFMEHSTETTQNKALEFILKQKAVKDSSNLSKYFNKFNAS